MELCGLTVIFIIHLYFFCKLSKEVLCPIVCWCVEFCLFPSKAFQIFQHFSYTYMYAYVGACVCMLQYFCSYLGKLVSWCCVTKNYETQCLTIILYHCSLVFGQSFYGFLILTAVSNVSAVSYGVGRCFC